jgi:two-component system, NarL family, response regulator YdfI
VTRILIAAPSSVVRAGLEAILRESPDLTVVGTLSGLATLQHETAALRPDVVLIAEGNGHDSVPLPLLPDMPALVLLVDDPEGAAGADALRSGGRAVLPRDAQPQQIVAAVRAVASGLTVLAAETTASLLQHLTGYAPADDSGPIESLTPREVEVLSMLAEGAGNKQIARRLGISEHTVKFHVGSIMSKLGASSRTEAVTVGIRNGLVLL